MAVGDLGNLRIGVEIDPNKVAPGLAAVESKVKESAKRMEKSILDTKLFGGAIGGVAIFAGLDGAAKLATAAIHGLRGETEGMRDALFSLPLGIGQFARSVDGLVQAVQNLKSADVNPLLEGKRKLFDESRLSADARRQELQSKADTAGLEGPALQRAMVEEEAKKRLQKLSEEQKKTFATGLGDEKTMRQFNREAELIEKIRVDSLAKIDREEQKKASERMEREEKQQREQAEREAKEADRAATEKAKKLRDTSLEIKTTELRINRDFRAAERLEIQEEAKFRIDDAIKAGDMPLAEAERKRGGLRLTEFDSKRMDTESLSATGVGLRVPGVNREPPDKRGQDRTNMLLETVIVQLRNRAGVALAG